MEALGPVQDAMEGRIAPNSAFARYDVQEEVKQLTDQW